MKKLFCVVLSVVFTFLFCAQALACTSFAVNSRQKLYGMNLDFTNSELRIQLKSYSDLRIIALSTRWNQEYYQNFGMNSNGLCMAIQDLNPNPGQPAKITQNSIDVNDFARMALRNFSTVEEVRQFLNNNSLTNNVHSSHVFFADKTGDSAVVESSTKGNVIINGNRRFQVMTNFSNTLLQTQDYTSLNCESSDRYKTAYEDIKENFQNYDIDKAFATLDKSKQNNSTIASIVYDPEKREIYICLNRRFDKVWKISMDDDTIETYKGFFKPLKMLFYDDDVWSFNLIEYENMDLENKGIFDEAALKNTPKAFMTLGPTPVSVINSTKNAAANIVTAQPAITAQSTEAVLGVFNSEDNNSSSGIDPIIFYIGIPLVIVVTGIILFIIRSYKLKKKKLLPDDVSDDVISEDDIKNSERDK